MPERAKIFGIYFPVLQRVASERHTMSLMKKKTDASSEAGSVIGLLVIGAILLGLYGFFSPYNPNGALANAAR
ncbi:hypothetical protein AK829_10230 [Corynebacterium riegelii]|uniref:Uncharacterized protein n=1 Tax=Corynebacterium riegelii TaxID=156976 RepID=A0A0K1RDE8_9CORY|nr:hypothetical protein AK829_10230 [Corynebacterium riegelii]PLA14358.1 hypothetical protein CYJ48_04155 [Corynebacterium riegelii]